MIIATRWAKIHGIDYYASEAEAEAAGARLAGQHVEGRLANPIPLGRAPQFDRVELTDADKAAMKEWEPTHSAAPTPIPQFAVRVN